MKQSGEFAVALLAGGKSRRMGKDKALIQLDGGPLWKRGLELLRRLEPSKLIVSLNSEQLELGEDVSGAGAEVVVDQPGCSDPLSALEQCLSAAKGLPVLLMAVDMPAMSDVFLRDRLLSGVSFEGGRCFRGKRLQPFGAIYPQSILRTVSEQLAKADFSLSNCILRAQEEGLMEELALAPEEEYYFENVNRPEDMQAFRHGR